MRTQRNNMKQFKSIHHQQGWTVWSLMFVLSVLFVLAYLGMQLIPIYSTNGAVRTAMVQSVEGQDLRKVTRRHVIGEMNKQLYIDSNHEVLDYKNDVKMSRTRNKFVLEANYVREVPLVANLVLIARFNPKVECDLTGRCDP